MDPRKNTALAGFLVGAGLLVGFLVYQRNKSDIEKTKSASTAAPAVAGAKPAAEPPAKLSAKPAAKTAVKPPPQSKKADAQKADLKKPTFTWEKVC